MAIDTELRKLTSEEMAKYHVNVGISLLVSLVVAAALIAGLYYCFKKQIKAYLHHLELKYVVPFIVR